jgi:hypothetical protein
VQISQLYANLNLSIKDPSTTLDKRTLQNSLQRQLNNIQEQFKTNKGKSKSRGTLSTQRTKDFASPRYNTSQAQPLAASTTGQS